MTQSKGSSTVRAGTIEGIDAGVSVDHMERGDMEAEPDTDTLLVESRDTKDTATPARPTIVWTRNRMFMASLVLVVAIIGTLIGVFVSRADDNGGGRTPVSGSRTESTYVEPTTTSVCKDCKEEGYFCLYLEGDCGARGEGNCTLKPEICTLDYTPVCGCDGVTYGNACSAASAGVSIDIQGECDTPSQGCSDCKEEGYFCFLPEGDCGAGGKGNCTLKPELCTMDYTPVCGCDGVTYGNACGAASAGVSIDFQGECDTPSQGCSDCNEEGYFCLFPEGDCGAGGEGNCTLKPEICTLDYTPVCGCDGVTYGNACGAASAGVSIDFQGECDTSSQGCSDCNEEGYFCLFPEGDCGAGGEGNCTLKPEICTLDYTPVCGCDGVTYGNACGAASAGASISFQGECDTPSQGCSDCEGEDVVCVFPEGDCGALLVGECTPKPDFCNRMEAPVCGCDGMSYLNGCIAISEGASIYAQGEC